MEMLKTESNRGQSIAYLIFGQEVEGGWVW